MTGKPAFSNGPIILHRNPPKRIILESWVFENFILADEPFAKALKTFEACLLFNNDLCEKSHHLINQPHLVKDLKLHQ